MENNFIFPGQYCDADADADLHYNYHRYYDPETGRNLTPDPIGLEGGINPFVYTSNNPFNVIDPLGFCVWGINTPPCVRIVVRVIPGNQPPASAVAGIRMWTTT